MASRVDTENTFERYHQYRFLKLSFLERTVHIKEKKTRISMVRRKGATDRYM